MALRFLLSLLRTKEEYDLAQAFVAVFLRIHGTELGAGDDEVRSLLSELKGVEEKEGGRLLMLLDETLCLIQYLSNAQAY